MRILNFFLLYILIFSFQACNKGETPTIVNLNGDKILLLGHAGAGLYHMNSVPDNSAEAVERAIDGYGADGVEVDIQLSADSVIFLYHDENLQSKSICSGCISERSSAYINTCYLTRNFTTTLAQKFEIPTLESIFKKYREKKEKLTFYLNIKSESCYGNYGSDTEYLTAISRQIVKLVQRYGLEKRTIVEVNKDIIGEVIRSLNPEIRLFYTVDNLTYDIPKAIEKGMDGVVVGSEITKEDIAHLHQNNVWVALMPEGTKKDIKTAINKGPEIILTDNMEVTIRLLQGQ